MLQRGCRLNIRFPAPLLRLGFTAGCLGGFRAIEGGRALGDAPSASPLSSAASFRFSAQRARSFRSTRPLPPRSPWLFRRWYGGFRFCAGRWLPACSLPVRRSASGARGSGEWLYVCVDGCCRMGTLFCSPWGAPGLPLRGLPVGLPLACLRCRLLPLWPVVPRLPRLFRSLPGCLAAGSHPVMLWPAYLERPLFRCFYRCGSSLLPSCGARSSGFSACSGRGYRPPSGPLTTPSEVLGCLLLLASGWGR